MKIFIKNMVCDRCIMVVRSEMDKLGHMVDQISLGEVTLQKDLTHDEKIKLDKALKSVGFRLIEEKRTQLVEQIKTLIIELIHHRQEDSDLNYSDYLSQKLLHDYKYLSSLFSESEGLTIEKYIIFQKTERVKELLNYGELSLSQIANEMNYSSVAYLSSQFKRVTNMTPGQYKNSKNPNRMPLDDLKVS